MPCQQTKRSRQRELILEVLTSTDQHPTADWIYTRLKPTLPDLSLGTVYRNLNLFVKQGLVKRIDNGSSQDRYDARTQAHYHFVCQDCGRISDLDYPVDEKLEKRVRQKTGLPIQGHRIDFFGLCPGCQDNDCELQKAVGK